MPPPCPGKADRGKMPGAFVSCACGPTELVVAPHLGGGIVSLRAHSRNVFAAAFPHPDNRELLLSGIVLTPFSNRIGNGAFEWGGERLAVPRTLADEPFPIHGNGFLQPWSALQAAQTELSLRLPTSEIGPFRYSAEQHFRIAEDSFLWSASLTNRATTALPYGIGLHPWFPRSPATRLAFSATEVWIGDEQRLPMRHVAIETVPAWNFAQAHALPDTEIDHAFTGWNGRAHIAQGPEHVSVSVEASENLSTAIVYAPGAKSPYFCFEPVSHPVNAYNLPGLPGLAILSPGQSIVATMCVRWQRS